MIVGRNDNSPVSHCSKCKTEQSDRQPRGAIKIKPRAAALEGKANAALISFLAEELKIPRRAIVLERGQKSRDKLIRIEGLSDKEVRSRLITEIP